MVMVVQRQLPGPSYLTTHIPHHVLAASSSPQNVCQKEVSGSNAEFFSQVM